MDLPILTGCVVNLYFSDLTSHLFQSLDLDTSRPDFSIPRVQKNVL
jgi:hypothetical protein